MQWDSTNQLAGCSYGGIERYHGSHTLEGSNQECSRFVFRFVSPADEYMLLNPLQCGGNADRIIRTWEPLVQQFRQAAGQYAGIGSSSSIISSKTRRCSLDHVKGRGGAARVGRMGASMRDSCANRSAAAAGGCASNSWCQLEAAGPAIASPSGGAQLAMQLMSWCLLGKQLMDATVGDLEGAISCRQCCNVCAWLSSIQSLLLPAVCRKTKQPARLHKLRPCHVSHLHE